MCTKTEIEKTTISTSKNGYELKDYHFAFGKRLLSNMVLEAESPIGCVLQELKHKWPQKKDPKIYHDNIIIKAKDPPPPHTIIINKHYNKQDKINLHNDCK